MKTIAFCPINHGVLMYDGAIIHDDVSEADRVFISGFNAPDDCIILIPISGPVIDGSDPINIRQVDGEWTVIDWSEPPVTALQKVGGSGTDSSDIGSVC